jgi:hypothetical protein
MTRKLTKLVVDEVSSVSTGANPGARVVLMKRHDPDDRTPHRERLRKLFEAIPFGKLAIDKTDDDDIGIDDDVGALDPKIESMVATVMALPPRRDFKGGKWVTEPPWTPETALEFLLLNAHGRRLAEHLNNLSKGEAPMNRSEEMQQMRKEGGMAAVNKHIIEKGSASGLTEGKYTEWAQEDARQKCISLEKAMDWRAYAIVREAGHVQALGYTKDLAPQPRAVEPLPGVGLTYDQLLEMRAAT